MATRTGPAGAGEFTIDRREEERMLAAFTPEKVMRVMTEAAHAGGMGPPSLGPRDQRIPWATRLERLEKILRDYAEGGGW